ncbi:cysteine desulfurase [Suttonella sp. R2A3]|uniref:cysteine desulfurase family protein n=1 Tax=Suttonella sp. R2A3 TaxID=2908648 RepID=UPI001F192841|nr:cysteine desulfurase family protein [Suttonella sp. R2A3]UJF25277.1 cysteine desulfurase [Suttonella sp. R2A3]
MTEMAYFDYAAMTPIDPRVLAALNAEFNQVVGNAGALHSSALAARARVENARKRVAQTINADPREVVFTSGATEADNLAIKGALTYHGAKNPRLITVQSEHKAVLDSAAVMAKQGVDVVVLSVRRDGLIDLDALEAALAGAPTTLVSVMAVNNETGVIQPLSEIAERVHAAGAKFHVDAAQAPGRMAVDMAEWGADLASFSGQKIYGPQGIGALFVRRLPKVRLQAQLHGGGQERGRRSGTLPQALIAAFAEAMVIADSERARHNATVSALRERLLASLPATMNLNTDAPSVAHIINIDSGVPSNEALARADAAGVALSAGSACSSSREGSHVLQAMGLDDQARRCLRISLSHLTTELELDRLIAFLQTLEAAK